jgi:hypothetical protein
MVHSQELKSLILTECVPACSRYVLGVRAAPVVLGSSTGDRRHLRAICPTPDGGNLNTS